MTDLDEIEQQYNAYNTGTDGWMRGDPPPDVVDRIPELLAEVRDHRALLDLQYRRMAEATDRWRAEDPEARALVMPDLGDLLRWLMDDADKARAALAELDVNWASQ